MKKRILILLIIFGCLLCSCSNNNQQDTPILNENGKEEIVLCLPGVGTYMRNTVANYNKQSDVYEVVILECPKDISVFDFRRNIQLELTNGKGPDILSYDSFEDFNLFPYAEDGYLMDVTDFISEQTDIVEAAKKYIKVEEKIYAVPINIGISTVYTADTYAVEKTDNTLEYWITITRNTDTQFGKYGKYLLEMLGVGVDGIQLFVDENNGISHFEQKEFVELLEFAKRYGYADIGESLKDRVSSGKQIFWSCTIAHFKDFWFHESRSNGTPSYIGFPTNEGGKHFLLCNCYAINNASKHKEGALDFLKYLLSDEQQRISFDKDEGFPVRESVLTDLWNEAIEAPYKGSDGIVAYESSGYYHEIRKMKEEEEAIFWEMLKDPLLDYVYNPIRAIVAEETTPFFNGDKTAEEVAKIIDNRVQLYLDETK